MGNTVKQGEIGTTVCMGHAYRSRDFTKAKDIGPQSIVQYM